MVYNVACFSKKRLSWMAAAALSSCIAQSALACSTEDYTGTVCMTAASYCPNGYLEAQGQIVSVNQYQALFSLLGTVYGGDGRTTFGIPDLRGRAMIGYGQGPGLSNVPIGLKRGQESVTQTVAQMPVHTHAATFQPAGGGAVSVTLTAKQVSGQNQPEQGFMLGAGAATGPMQAPIYVDPATPGNTVTLGGVTVTGGGSGGGTVTIGATGASQPTPTIPPQIALRACIAVNGIYPPRP